MKITLEELSEKPYPIVFDTSGIFTFHKDKIPIDVKGQFTVAREYYDSLSLMIKYMKRGSNFYIIPSVSIELTSPIKICQLLDLYRKKSNYREERYLIDAFEKNNKVLQLDNDPLYKALYKKYNNLEYDLSEPDKEVLISVITLIKSRNSRSIGLVCNDGGIFRTKINILRNEKIWSKRLKFFIRNGCYFEKIKRFPYIQST